MKLVPTSISPVTITLYRGIPFDNNYEEHTLLSNKFKFKAYSDSTPTNIGNDKEAFINMVKDGSYVYPRTTKSGTYNFAFGNGLVTSVVMELTGNEINSNYMKVVASDGLGNSETYYYFITGITQKNEVTYLLNLELDVVMTYSEEFLTNIEHKPVMVERKHCRRVQRTKFGTSLTTKINPVCFNQESTFSKLKASVVKEFTRLQFKDFIGQGEDDYNEAMSKFKWIYIIYAKYENYPNFYVENDVTYPYNIICFPTNNMKIRFTDFQQVQKVCECRARDILNTFVGDTKVLKIILSPFPPFKDITNMYYQYEQGSPNDCFGFYLLSGYDSTKHYYILNTGANHSGTRIRLYITSGEDTNYMEGYPLIEIGYGGKFKYGGIENYFNTNIPLVSNLRDVGEYKLQLSPFKDLRMSSYYGEENHIATQYLFFKDNFNLSFYSVVSSNAETNSFYDYSNADEYGISAKRGVTNSVAYNYPTGSNAELLFNQTQRNQYENSKVINAISNGLKIVGGGLSIAFSPNTMGKIGGGFDIAGGVTGEIQTFTNWGAKMEDLKNTPNTYNFSGSSFPLDYAISISNNDNSMLPYLITYGVTPIEENMSSEFLYNYGYEYNTNSEFSTLLTHNTDYVFERRLFNYVKIREDISTKLVGDNLPIIVAQKINEILNAGIKLWTFFGFNFSSPQDVTDIVDSYFQKDTYCNAEVVNEQFE